LCQAIKNFKGLRKAELVYVYHRMLRNILFLFSYCSPRKT